MRLASFNVENLFDRARVMQQDTWADGKDVLQAFADLNELLGEQKYTDPRKAEMVRLMRKLGLERSDKGTFVILRRNRGGLLRRPRGGGLIILAKGRSDWSGSLELIDAPVNERAMRNTARVMSDIQADILAVVEAENRPSLAEFNDQIISAVGGEPYDHVMLIDGNDKRGIDVGILTRKGHSISSMRSHVDDKQPNGQYVFSRDCAQYSVDTPARNTIIVLINHLKSKGYGNTRASNARRKAQATRVAEIYKQLVNEGKEHVAVVGDFNDTPDSDPLSPLIQETNLKDVFEHDEFEDGGYPGTYGYCRANQKIDYILLSPALFDRVERGGLRREGMWPGVKPEPRWAVYDEVSKPKYAASDHAALWVDIDV